MQEQTKQDIAFLIEDNRTKIRNFDPTKSEAPTPEESLKENVLAAWERLNRLQTILLELEPYILNIRTKIADITEETFICALYLLLCTTLKNFHAVISLVECGHYSGAMTILRTVDESIMQCSLFANESFQNDTKHLEKWFAWSLIEHGTARKELDKLIPQTAVDLNTLASYLYQMESQFAHNSYLSVVENMSPFTKDFDFNWPTGFYRGVSALDMAFRELSHLVIVLREVYIMALQDPSFESELEGFMKKFGMNASVSHEAEQDMQSKFWRKATL